MGSAGLAVVHVGVLPCYFGVGVGWGVLLGSDEVDRCLRTMSLGVTWCPSKFVKIVRLPHHETRGSDEAADSGKPG